MATLIVPLSLKALLALHTAPLTVTSGVAPFSDPPAPLKSSMNSVVCAWTEPTNKSKPLKAAAVRVVRRDVIARISPVNTDEQDTRDRRALGAHRAGKPCSVKLTPTN